MCHVRGGGAALAVLPRAQDHLGTALLRRRAQRAPQDQRNARFQFHKEELKKYMRKVKTAKNSRWKSFCTKASNPYGTHYKAAFRKAIKPAELIALNNHDPSGNHLKIAQYILEKIFPILLVIVLLTTSPTVIVLLTSRLAPQTTAPSPKEK
ncbi:hypothetical protein AVEN_146696-1 [Araneus ventricosus]|uniref:Uncharacterized protein n=1 Tax=Araneus ventricosus TaxID=182803 RepID=A0A4Y2SSB4_ARAVE|nr:hypothetical protein AVEN_146696-1 [Araneus ventricosus]